MISLSCNDSKRSSCAAVDDALAALGDTGIGDGLVNVYREEGSSKTVTSYLVTSGSLVVGMIGSGVMKCDCGGDGV